MPKGETITPDGVRRNHVRGGYIVPMADGREWQIPSIACLPHQYGMDAEGQLTRTVKTEFKEFHKQAQRYIKQIFCAFEEAEVVGQENPLLPDDTAAVVITLEDSFAFCSLALSINYRLTASIVAMLGLLDDKAMRQVIRAACDVPSLMTGEPRKGPIVGAKETINIPVGLAG